MILQLYYSSTTARLWNVDTEEEFQQLGGHAKAVNSVIVSPDGKTFLTGSNDMAARLWDAETGDELQRFTKHIGLLNSVAFNSTGSLIALGSHNLIVPGSQAQTVSIISFWKLNYDLTGEKKEQACRVYLEKRLYTVLAGAPQEDQPSGDTDVILHKKRSLITTGTPQEESSCKTRPTLGNDSQIEFCALL